MPAVPRPDAAEMPPLTSEQWKWRWRILISTYVGYAGYYLTRKVFTICKTSIAEEMNWELSDTAHIWTAFLFAYMLGQFINSFVGRKWGPRVIMLGGLGISVVCNTIFGFANSFSTFMVFMFINGLVQASGWPGCVGGVSHWLREHERGTIMGVWTTNHVVGNLVVKSLGGALLAAAGWRWAFFGMSILTVAVWWLLWFWQRDKPEDAGLEPIVDTSREANRAVQASEADHVSLSEYLKVLFSPFILIMGSGYFCVKFLRYALDSWLPAFLNLQGLSVADASYYSTIFDWAGIAGTIAAGYALDKWFRGNWPMLCFTMSVGAILGYIAVMYAGTNPLTIALCFGFVGFMIYGPDSLLTGAAAISVAGGANAVAVAGIVNGIGSIGPVVQEEVIGWLMRGDAAEGIRNTNILALSMSVVLAVMMLAVSWSYRRAHREGAKREE
jgi:sugar phosphate permease